MSKSIFPAFVAMVALATGAIHADPVRAAEGAAAATAAPQPDLTMALRKDFIAAQKALQEKRFPDVVSKVNEILSKSDRKPDDNYYAYYLLFRADLGLNKQDEARKALEGLVDSGFLTPQQSAPYVKALMTTAFGAKDYDGAIDYGTRLTKANLGDPEVFSTIGQSYFLKNDFTDAARFYNSLISEQIKRGQTPREHDLRMLATTYSRLGDKPSETDAIEKLVVYYPKPEYWEPLMYAVRKIASMQPRQKLQVCRLMRATKTLKTSSDYSDCYGYALAAGLPAEAEDFLEAGLKANVFTDATDKASAERRAKSAASTVTSDKASLPKLETDAKAAGTGSLDVALGMMEFSYGDFAKSVDALQRGLGKGGLKDDTQIEATVTLAVAQIQAGNKSDALKTLKSVKTDDKDWQRIARLWKLYAS